MRSVLAATNAGSAGSAAQVAARHAQAPSGYSALGGNTSAGTGLGLTAASQADSQLLVLITALLATLAIGVLSLDAIGAGPRSRRWRARWLVTPARAMRRKKRW
jgi:hypothetical protein